MRACRGYDRGYYSFQQLKYGLPKETAPSVYCRSAITSVSLQNCRTGSPHAFSALHHFRPLSEWRHNNVSFSLPHPIPAGVHLGFCCNKKKDDRKQAGTGAFVTVTDLVPGAETAPALVLFPPQAFRDNAAAGIAATIAD